jgi:hypothetical protein
VLRVLLQLQSGVKKDPTSEADCGRGKMKAGKAKFAVAGLLLIGALLPGMASARVSFHISFGSSRLCGYPYTHYPWGHRGYSGYTWIERHRYGWSDSHRYRYPYSYGWFDYYHHIPPCSSGLSISTGTIGLWISDYSSRITGCPVIVQAPAVVSNSQAAASHERTNTDSYQKPVALLKQPRLDKNELLKTVAAENKEQRLEAVRDLAAYSLDDSVRKTLEDILLSDPDPELRTEAAKSLGRLTNQRALAALEKAKAQDVVRAVRQQAYRSIIRIKGY